MIRSYRAPAYFIESCAAVLAALLFSLALIALANRVRQDALDECVEPAHHSIVLPPMLVDVTDVPPPRERIVL